MTGGLEQQEYKATATSFLSLVPSVLLLRSTPQLQLDGEARVVPPDYFAQGNAGEKLLSVDLTPEPIVPCPRRFGATFAPNGFLVVFSSALAVVRARVGVSAGDNSGGKTPKEVNEAPCW